jgi:hypothetical protein
MKFSPEQKSARMQATRGAAIALVEDMPHIRGVMSKEEPSRGELRRLSATLRRILCERDLSNIAAPRIGRIILQAPDNKPVIKSDKIEPLEFFLSGGALIFGIYIRAGLLHRGSRPRPIHFDPEATIDLRLDGFLTQPVLCLQGQWASRKDIITFAANVGSGVHSGTAKEESHKLLDKARHSASIGITETPDGSKTVNFTLNVYPFGAPATPFDYQPDCIDPILVELLAAAHFLAISPVVVRLEKFIKEELGV